MIEKAIETITRIEKDDIKLSEKRYYIRKCIIDLLDKVDKFDMININEFIKKLFADLSENDFGEVCFRIKKYLNEIKGWYDE